MFLRACVQLVRPNHEAGSTSKISREHRILESAGGLVSVLGGKWTTFRKMAEDVVDVVEEVGQLAPRATETRDLRLEIDAGSVASAPDAAPTTEQTVTAAQSEFARTVEDVLARRFRCLLLDARQSIEWAPDVARVLATELNRPDGWQDAQVEAYTKLAKQYLLEDDQ